MLRSYGNNLDCGLTLCVIAKDEEVNLPRCLSSVKGLAGQVVVVDTGSKDRTAGVAASLGAEVHSFPWADDFSAAKNHALSFAVNPWILMLDADEELEGRGRGLVPMALKSAMSRDVDALYFDLVNVDASGKVSNSPSRQCRAFRNMRGIHFEGRIHEVPVGFNFAERAESRILHYGYLGIGPERFAAKVARNIAILFKSLEENPNDFRLSWMLGRELHLAGRDAEAAERLSQYVSRAPSPSPDARMYLALTLQRLDRHGDALAELSDAASAHPGLMIFNLLSACSMAALERWAECLEAVDAYFVKLAEFESGHVLKGELSVFGPESVGKGFSLLARSMGKLGRFDELQTRLTAALMAGQTEAHSAFYIIYVDHGKRRALRLAERVAKTVRTEGLKDFIVKIAGGMDVSNFPHLAKIRELLAGWDGGNHV